MQALLLLAIVTFLGGAAVFVYLASLPYVGFEFSGESVVGAVAPGGPAAAAGLQVGDRILTIDGLPPMSSGEIYLRPGAGTLQLEVAREGQTLGAGDDSEAAIAGNVSWTRPVTFSWPWASGSSPCWSSSSSPGIPVAQFFVLLTLLGTAVIVIWSMADLGALWANLLMGVLAAAIGPMFVHYHTLFPERSHFRGKRALLAVAVRRWRRAGCAVPVAGCALLHGALPAAWAPIPGPRRRRRSRSTSPFCLVIGLVLLGRTYRVTQSEQSKRQIALVALGSAASPAAAHRPDPDPPDPVRPLPGAVLDPAADAGLHSRPAISMPPIATI